jgi:hypothetical protein
MEANCPFEVLGDANTVSIHGPKVVAAQHVSAVTSLLVETDCVPEVLRNAGAILVDESQVITTLDGSIVTDFLV